MVFVKSVINRESEQAQRAAIRRSNWRKATLAKVQGPIDPFMRLLLTEELARDAARNAR